MGDGDAITVFIEAGVSVAIFVEVAVTVDAGVSSSVTGPPQAWLMNNATNKTSNNFPR